MTSAIRLEGENPQELYQQELIEFARTFVEDIETLKGVKNGNFSQELYKLMWDNPKYQVLIRIYMDFSNISANGCAFSELREKGYSWEDITRLQQLMTPIARIFPVIKPLIEDSLKADSSR